jgi:hypothetical protein
MMWREIEIKHPDRKMKSWLRRCSVVVVVQECWLDPHWMIEFAFALGSIVDFLEE